MKVLLVEQLEEILWMEWSIKRFYWWCILLHKLICNTMLNYASSGNILILARTLMFIFVWNENSWMKLENQMCNLDFALWQHRQGDLEFTPPIELTSVFYAGLVEIVKCIFFLILYYYLPIICRINRNVVDFSLPDCTYCIRLRWH